MVRVHDIDSRHLGMRRRISVWVPASQGRGNGHLPVLYLNDGQNLFDSSRAFAGTTWRVAETAERLVRRGRIPALVIVGIDHGESRRAREYLPVEDDRNPGARGPLGGEYAQFVTREVMPFVARAYGVGRGAAHTGFGGSSYGAIAALYTSLVRPGTCGRLLLESPSLYVAHGYMLRRAAAARRWPWRVYIGVGTAETSRGDWNEETVVNVLKLAQILQRRGLGAKRLRVAIEEGATHAESAWANRFEAALEFLYGR